MAFVLLRALSALALMSGACAGYGRWGGEVDTNAYPRHVEGTEDPSIHCHCRLNSGKACSGVWDCPDPNGVSEQGANGLMTTTRFLANSNCGGCDSCPAGYLRSTAPSCWGWIFYASCDVFCYQCPSGSYSAAGQIYARDDNTKHCVYCPPGLTTEAPGATSEAQCTVPLVYFDVPGYGPSWWDCNTLVDSGLQTQCVALRNASHPSSALAFGTASSTLSTLAAKRTQRSSSAAPGTAGALAAAALVAAATLCLVRGAAWA